MAATIDIRRSHNLTQEHVRRLVDGLASELQSTLAMRYHWEGPELLFTRWGANGRIHVGTTDIRIEVNVGLMFRPLKNKIEGEIHTYLDTHLR